MVPDPRQLAHDLNNILAVISGYAYRLEETIDEADPRRLDVQAILAELPRFTSTVESVRALGGSPAGAPEAPVPVRQSRILLVEDEAAVRDLLRLVLERRGYHVDLACTGEEGLALCDTIEPPDLLITDLILPGASGPAVAESLRERIPGLKVLLISGYAEHALLDAAHAAGEPSLVKPFEISIFAATVKQLLEERRAAA